MQATINLFEVGLLIWSAALVAFIASVLSGDIEVSGILAQSKSTDTSIPPERVVMVAVFPAIIVGYAVHAIQAEVHGTLPDIPDDSCDPSDWQY